MYDNIVVWIKLKTLWVQKKKIRGNYILQKFLRGERGRKSLIFKF